MSYQLIEVVCDGCEKPFYVPESNAFAPDAHLCQSCRCFKAAMEHMMGTAPRIPPPPERMDPLRKGMIWGVVFIAPLWIAVLYFWLR